MADIVAATGTPVQRVAFGAEQLGGHQWGVVDVGEIEKAIELALEVGVTFFDTADCYGRGESESRLGAALGSRRSRAFVSTKFGVRFDAGGRVYYDNSPDYAEKALDGSLKRLSVDYVDLFQVHWPDGVTLLPEILARLEEFCDDGRIRSYGLCNVPAHNIAQIPGEWPGFASFSLQYNLAHRWQEAEIRHLCEDRGLVFLSWGSLGMGLLSGKYDRASTFPSNDRRSRMGSSYFDGTEVDRKMRLVEQLRSICEDMPGVRPSQAAIRFILRSLPHSIAIVGAKNGQQFLENRDAETVPFTESAFEMLDAESRWAMRS